MRYRLVEKGWSWFGDSFVVRDRAGRDMYRVRRGTSAPRERIAIEAITGDEVASVADDPPGHWAITCRGAPAAVVTREYRSALRWRLVIDAPGLDREIGRRRHRYALTAGGAEVATVRMRWTLWRNAFDIDLAPASEPLLVLSVAVVIALINRG